MDYFFGKWLEQVAGDYALLLSFLISALVTGLIVIAVMITRWVSGGFKKNDNTR